MSNQVIGNNKSNKNRLSRLGFLGEIFTQVAILNLISFLIVGIPILIIFYFGENISEIYDKLEISKLGTYYKIIRNQVFYALGLLYLSVFILIFYNSSIKRLRSLNIKPIYFNIYLVFMYLFIVILNIDILFYISLISLALVFILLLALPNSKKVVMEEIKEEPYTNKSYYIDIILVIVMLVFLLSLIFYHPSI
ncbi:hypothetical protein AAX26_01968 [Aliarcobacter thereius]|uniref:hypothetical protein n=1 Tax=Aliarcobacter thereius TaxID=544718 RepID=UPI000828C2D5|nr:hypothetical protein [Aliarcobacter thereius]OCL85540.1 hypothetical protein AAX26_01968 [Aliarcobacter thereius]